MNLGEEVKKAIEATPKIAKESADALYIRIMRLINESRKPTGQKLGVTIMTEDASIAGDEVARNRNAKQDPGSSRPKSL
jgi:hypothetical protein